MKISDIKDDHELAIAWGVEIDEEIFDPPANLRTIGLLWEGSAPDSISDRLIDTVIAFTLSGAEVIIEVRPDDVVDYDYLLKLAGNAGFSVAAIPPTEKSGLDNWVKHCTSFSQSLLEVPNFSGHLYPVTGYVTYLVMEFFCGADAVAPNDEYTAERFFNATPTEWSDEAKSHMRRAMSDSLGGEDELKSYLGALLKAIQDEAKKQFLEDMSSYEMS